MNRRRFCKSAGAMAMAAGATRVWPQPATVTLTLRSTIQRHVPETFTGLSYELAQLTEPGFFSAKHTDLVALFRCLSPTGILRLGVLTILAGVPLSGRRLGAGPFTGHGAGAAVPVGLL